MPEFVDSQHDSQWAGQLRTRVNDHGIVKLVTELQWTLMDAHGRQARGLQNRLRGAVEASWVGSIPIHPRQSWPFLAAMTAKTTAKPHNGSKIVCATAVAWAVTDL